MISQKKKLFKEISQLIYMTLLNNEFNNCYFSYSWATLLLQFKGKNFLSCKRVQQILITKHCLLCTNISICWNRTFLLLKVHKEKNFAVEILQLLRNKTFSLVTIWGNQQTKALLQEPPIIKNKDLPGFSNSKVTTFRITIYSLLVKASFT